MLSNQQRSFRPLVIPTEKSRLVDVTQTSTGAASQRDPRQQNPFADSFSSFPPRQPRNVTEESPKIETPDDARRSSVSPPQTRNPVFVRKNPFVWTRFPWQRCQRSESLSHREGNSPCSVPKGFFRFGKKSRHRKTSTLSPSEAQQLNGLFLRLNCWNARLIHSGRSKRDAETVLAVDNSQKKNVCRHLLTRPTYLN